MRWKLDKVWHCRPRVLTLALLFIAGTLLMLSNLSEDYHPRRAPSTPNAADWGFDAHESDPRYPPLAGEFRALSSGWPLLWKQYVILQGLCGAVVVGWRYSMARLACNVMMWLVMLAVPAAACEWGLRRYRPKLRFSLRGMLAAVGLVALFFGSFAWARNRADAEDALSDAIKSAGGDVWVERWGPKWLDFVGADRYRRGIVAARITLAPSDDDGEDNLAARELLRRLAQLPKLQYLLFYTDDLTPDLAVLLRDFSQLRTLSIESETVFPGAIETLGEALGNMPRLRVLGVSPGSACVGDDASAATDGDACLEDDERIGREYMAAIGKATSLERLFLSRITLCSESLTQLAALTRLKSLSLRNVDCREDASNPSPLLSGLPPLAKLETVELGTWVGGFFVDDDNLLSYLTRLPHLRSLHLLNARVTGDGLAKLAPLKSLEELSLMGGVLTAVTLEPLRNLENLKRLHIPFGYEQRSTQDSTFEIVPHVEPGELQKSLRALQALRDTHPGIVIDGDWSAGGWNLTELIPHEFEMPDRLHTHVICELVRKWKEAGCPAYPLCTPGK